MDAATEAHVLERLDRRLTRTGQGMVVVTYRTAVLGLCDDIVQLDAAPSLAATSPDSFELLAVCQPTGSA